MSPKFLAFATLALGLVAPLVGCGEERMERGLAAPDEQADPIDAAEERMTEKQRRQLETKEDDAAAARDFDGGGEGGGETNPPD